MESNTRAKRGYASIKFEEFCNRTDLHGYKYIVMSSLSIGERCCWAAALVASTAVAAYFVYTAYTWYARNPIVTVIESTHGAIWDVPFPAVTICDLNLISRRRALRFVETIQLPANTSAAVALASVRAAPMLHSPQLMAPEHVALLYTLQEILDLNNITVMQMLQTVGPVSCDNLIQRCSWKNTVYRCDLMFERLYTHQTLCCTFNYYGVDPPPSSSVNHPFRPPQPRRVASCGYQTALSVLVNIQPDDFYSSSVSAYGAVVYVDNAYNIPNVDSPVRFINPRTELFVAVAPELTYATAGVARFPVDVRQCIYANEKKLGNFNIYSYHNCIVYRTVGNILAACDCVPFYFSNILAANRTCDYRDLECIRKEQPKTRCLPDCEHYDYGLEVAVGMFAKNPPSSNIAFYKDLDIKNHSILNVFFNDLVSTRYRRDVYLNWQNLLASFGGLMSLMLGFTLISALDLLIFITFRVMYEPTNTGGDAGGHTHILNKKKKSISKDDGKTERMSFTTVERKWKGMEFGSPPAPPPRYEDTGRY